MHTITQYLFVCELLLLEPFSILLLMDSYILDVILLSGTFSTLYLSKNSYFTFKHWVQKLIQFYLNYLSILNSISFELTALWIYGLQILLSSDIEKNPGPSHNQINGFSTGFLSFCNWNLNTLSKDNFYRISLLEAHNTIYNYDIISLCETSLSNYIQAPENALPGYIYQSSFESP